jgi:hypothetical protein
VPQHGQARVPITAYWRDRRRSALGAPYALGDAELIEALRRVKDSFNSYPLGRIAQVGATASVRIKSDYETISLFQIGYTGSKHARTIRKRACRTFSAIVINGHRMTGRCDGSATKRRHKSGGSRRHCNPVQDELLLDRPQNSAHEGRQVIDHIGAFGPSPSRKHDRHRDRHRSRA